MTPDEAKALLNLCPPGEEANPLPGLDEAVKLAAANPDLAAWWAQEKDLDGQFSRKLALIAPPAELAATIMRGGATIFFASRLIAETTGETLEELPAMADDTDSKKSVADVMAKALAAENAPAPRNSLTWWWRAAVLSVILLVVLLLVMLLVLPASSNSGGPPGGELPSFAHYAAQLATIPPSPPSGQTIEEMRRYLTDHNAPNPTDPLSLLPDSNGATPIAVAADIWKTHHVANYIVQTGAETSHLFILNQSEFSHDEVAPKISASVVDGFRLETWSNGGFIYLSLRPGSAPP